MSDPFNRDHDAVELEIADEFLTNWFPFLTRDLYDSCSQTLADGIKSLCPDWSPVESPGHSEQNQPSGLEVVLTPNPLTPCLNLSKMIMLEGAKATVEIVDALRTRASAMKAMQKAANIDDVDKTMDEINEQTEDMKQIQEALATPIGPAVYFDEKRNWREVEGAELEEQLLQPATTAPAARVHVPAGRQPTRPGAQKNTAEEDELAALQAEMAM